MTAPKDALTADEYPIGTVLRGKGRFRPPPVEVRGHVDGCLVCRWWREAKECWKYTVVYPVDIEVGLYHKEVMKPLSSTMEACLREIRDRTTEGRPWAQIRSDRFTANTIKALARRGLIQVAYRIDRLNPNDTPTLTLQQALSENSMAGYQDPWVRLVPAEIP